MQYYSILSCSFNLEALITFHSSLLVSRTSELPKLARDLASVFGNTYTREQAL